MAARVSALDWPRLLSSPRTRLYLAQPRRHRPATQHLRVREMVRWSPRQHSHISKSQNLIELTNVLKRKVIMYEFVFE